MISSSNGGLVKAYGRLYKNRLFPVIQKILSRDTTAEIELAEKRQWDTPQSIREYQWSQVQKVLDVAYNHIDFYEKLYLSAGVPRDSISDLSDLSRLPLLERSNLQADPRAVIADNAPSKLEEGRTGGSTGEPARIYLDSAAISTRIAMLARARRWWGIDIGDPQVYLWGHYRMFDRSLSGRINASLKVWKDAIQNRRWVSAYDMSDKQMLDYYKVIKDFRPKLLLGYTSALYGMAGFFRREGLDASSLGIRAVITTSEVLYDWQKALLEEMFGAAVANEYGAVETGNIAYTCPDGKFHLADDNVYVEIVDSDGNPTDGVGEIVCTQLRNLSAPLIRHRTGDVGKVSNEPCSCGRNLRVLESMDGRALDLLVLPQGGYASPHLVLQILESVPSVTKMQIIQNDLESLDVSVVIQGEWGDDNENYIRSHVRRRFGDEVTVNINQVSDIPAEGSGKFRWVKSKIYANGLLPRP